MRRKIDWMQAVTVLLLGVAVVILVTRLPGLAWIGGNP